MLAPSIDHRCGLIPTDSDSSIAVGNAVPSEVATYGDSVANTRKITMLLVRSQPQSGIRNWLPCVLRSRFARYAAFGLLSLLWQFVLVDLVTAASPDKPNIVVIMADDK